MKEKTPAIPLSELPSTERMPVMFIGHGNPMNAIEDNDFSREWVRIRNTIPEPAAILCISAHWETFGTYVSGASQPETIHDFFGFPPSLSNLQYPAPGNPFLADDICKKLEKSSVSGNPGRGLDHGCWSVLVPMFPHAQIPVIQLSLDRNLTPERHFQLAKELSFLRRKGVLILGSGNIVHNLSMFDFSNSERPYEWAVSVNESIKKNICNNNYPDLLSPDKMGTAFHLAVPTAEHYIPMLYALALREKDEELHLFNDVVISSLSMTSFISGASCKAV